MYKMDMDATSLINVLKHIQQIISDYTDLDISYEGQLQALFQHSLFRRYVRIVRKGAAAAICEQYITHIYNSTHFTL